MKILTRLREAWRYLKRHQWWHNWQTARLMREIDAGYKPTKTLSDLVREGVPHKGGLVQLAQYLERYPNDAKRRR